MSHTMVQKVMRATAFFELLVKIDQEALEQMRHEGCPRCGGRLHTGHYKRKPRGEPEGVGEVFSTRFSLCCAEDGCRSRLTPPSVRFLSRKVYVGAAVVLAAAALQGVSPARVDRLCALLGMVPRTVRRWLAWWSGAFAQSGFFRGLRGHLHVAVEAGELPRALLDLLCPAGWSDGTLALLKLLRPITTATAPGAQPV